MEMLRVERLKYAANGSPPIRYQAQNQWHWIEIITKSMQIPTLWIEDPVGIGHPLRLDGKQSVFIMINLLGSFHVKSAVSYGLSDVR